MQIRRIGVDRAAVGTRVRSGRGGSACSAAELPGLANLLAEDYALLVDPLTVRDLGPACPPG